MKKSRLGKGLQALIPEIDETPLTESVKIDIDSITVNPYQPRKTFTEDKMAELVRSILEHGILQPLIVRATGDGYELVAGERRWRAAKAAGLEQVPVIIRQFSTREMMEIALIENLQREDLNPLEEAYAYRRLMDEFGYTQEQMAERLGKSRPAIANTLRLLTLHAAVREKVEKGELTEGHARALLALPLEKQPEAARKVTELGLSVRETEKMAAGETRVARSKSREKKQDAYLVDLEEKLRQSLGAPVKIKNGARGSGKIEISFYDPSELERLCELMLRFT